MTDIFYQHDQAFSSSIKQWITLNCTVKQAKDLFLYDMTKNQFILPHALSVELAKESLQENDKKEIIFKYFSELSQKLEIIQSIWFKVHEKCDKLNSLKLDQIHLRNKLKEDVMECKKEEQNSSACSVEENILVYKTNENTYLPISVPKIDNYLKLIKFILKNVDHPTHQYLVEMLDTNCQQYISAKLRIPFWFYSTLTLGKKLLFYWMCMEYMNLFTKEEGKTVLINAIQTWFVIHSRSKEDDTRSLKELRSNIESYLKVNDT